MKAPRRLLALALALAGGSLVVLSGCSLDGLLWGPDGARVIDTTDQLIAAAPSGEQDSLACERTGVEFGDAEMWDGLSPGEPEQFDPTDSVDRPELDATWRINLEGASLGDTSEAEIPTDVFYRDTESGLCVADVIWQRVEFG